MQCVSTKTETHVS